MKNDVASKTAPGQFHKGLLGEFAKRYPNEVTLLPYYQDEGANAIIKGKNALVLTHSQFSNIKYNFRISKKYGKAFVQNYIDGTLTNGDIDIVVCLLKLGNNFMGEYVNYPRVKDLLNRYKNNPEAFISYIYTYEEGNETLVLDAFLKQAAQPLFHETIIL